MLNPNIDSTVDMLTEVYNDIRGVSDYAFTCNSFVLGHVASDPQWLPSVRSRVADLRDVMNDFMEQKPDILSGIIVSFINYQTLFSAFSDQVSEVESNDRWLDLLETLKTTATESLGTTNSANMAFSDAYKNVSNTVFLLDDSINEGWQELSSEEAEMTRIAEAIGQLFQSISSLGATVTSADIRAEKSYLQSMVKMAYSVVMETASSVPYLTIATGLLSIGEGMYDTLKNASDVQDQLDKLTELQNEASQAAQAAAITKAVLQQLSELEKSFLRLNSSLPALALMWQGEVDKLTSAIDAINAGSDPSLLFDLQTTEIASASWQTITDFANQLRQPPGMGDSILINSEDHSIILNNNE
ncbi:alpha-pore-forming cytotoxin MakB [Endozoicomonas atrinae]|uniref:alpha-pore-forming cytotoxin subunit MakB n=1 Tax=Endozoicomonas atrinae TaxID=1333660 RepID=UPI003B0009E1